MTRNKPKKLPPAEGENIYSETEIDHVMAALGPNLKLTRTKIQRELEYCAGWYLSLHHTPEAYHNGDTPPSEEERMWQSIKNASNKALRILIKLPIDCQPTDMHELVTLQRSFNTKVNKHLETAKSRKRKHGRNMPDRPKRTFMHLLKIMIIEPSINETENFKVWNNRETNEKCGPLAEFLKAVFKPLQTGDSTEALVRSYLRMEKDITLQNKH